MLAQGLARLLFERGQVGFWGWGCFLGLGVVFGFGVVSLGWGLFLYFGSYYGVLVVVLGLGCFFVPACGVGVGGLLPASCWRDTW